jgi:hypothetical protein
MNIGGILENQLIKIKLVLTPTLLGINTFVQFVFVQVYFREKSV